MPFLRSVVYELRCLGRRCQRPPLGLRNEGTIATVPLGDLAGGAQSNVAGGITNPQAQDAQAGRELFVKLNCADCHGFTAKGGYGGTPAQLFKSIYEGRPKGMPAWGAALSPNDIWQLVAYILILWAAASLPATIKAAMQGDGASDLVTPELDFQQALDELIFLSSSQQVPSRRREACSPAVPHAVPEDVIGL